MLYQRCLSNGNQWMSRLDKIRVIIINTYSSPNSMQNSIGMFGHRGEWPPYWTTLVRSTYDQKKALGGFITRPYALSKCFVVFTMENWLKAGRTVSKPSVFSDTCAIFYLDKPQSFRNLFWTTPSSSRKVKNCINHHLTNSHLRVPTTDGTNN